MQFQEARQLQEDVKAFVLLSLRDTLVPEAALCLLTTPLAPAHRDATPRQVAAATLDEIRLWLISSLWGTFDEITVDQVLTYHALPGETKTLYLFNGASA